MNLSAFLLMLFVQGAIALITFYLFYRVLKNGKNKEEKKDKNRNE